VVEPSRAELESVGARLAESPRDPRTGAFWNAIARAWFVDVDGEVVRLDPQPPAPRTHVHGLVPNPRIDV
jgi:hypothetical protein